MTRPDSEIEPAGTGALLRVGFMPLIDCAPIVVAHEQGFAAAEGLVLELHRETSWANIRDRVFLGHFDAAHMLAPMAIAARLGIGHVRTPLIAPWVMTQGGNSVAVAPATFAADDDWGLPGDPVASGRALARIVAARAQSGAEPLTLAAVHPFSCHHYELCHWLEAAGIDPDRDVRMVVVPPPHMVEALSAGSVDIVCVGAPWTARAVEAGVGRLLVPGAALWPSVPEKVLAVREDRAERRPELLAALLRALDRASAWCADPANRGALAGLLARPEFVGVDAAVIERTLAGTLPVGAGEAPMRLGTFVRFHGIGGGGPVNRPREVDGLWFAAQMLRRGQYRDRREAFAAARRAFASDLWDRVFGRPEGAGTDVVTAFSGPTFAAAAPEVWLDAPVAAAE